ncbi:MAG: tRNA dihydrouridine synthase DusB [Pseudomonadota bacterium]
MSLPPLTIGTVVIPVPLVVAPMAGVTDRPFRQLCKRLGAGLAVSEMVGAQSLIQGAAKTARRACHLGEQSPRSVQIVGADPELMAQAARINADNGAEIIDINMGCPAKKVCNTLSGSALLRDEPLVAKILEAIVRASPVPVTLKMRTGWDKDSRNGVRIAKLAESLGIQALSIHGRTRCCFYNGDAEYDTIRDIKAAVKIPVLANGDITTPEKALHVLQYTGADGIMIGRGAQGNPWIFREIKHFFDTGTHMAEPTLFEIKETLTEHIEALYEFYGTDRGVHIARKHVSWYSKGQYGSSHFRDHFNRLDTADAQREALRVYFSQLLDSAAS